MRLELVVVGLGGVGSAVVCELARRGHRVVGLDRFHPPHDHGSSHGRSRIIRQAYFEDPAYVPLVLRAYDRWRALERDSDRRLLTITGGLMIGPPDSDIVTGALASAREHDLPHEVLDPDDVAARFPALRVDTDEVAVLEPNAGALFPEDAIAAHLELAEQAGAKLATGEAVEDVDERPGGGVEVRTSQRTLTADRVVVTAGAWVGDLRGLPVQVERQFVAWLRARAHPERYRAGRLPTFVAHHTEEVASYAIPELRGEGVKVAFHHGGETGHPDRLERQVRSEEIERIRSWVRDRLPDLDGEPIAAETCWYTNTADGHFAVGQDPDLPDVVLGGGFSGHGFKFSSALGEILADLAEGQPVPPELALFDPGRLR